MQAATLPPAIFLMGPTASGKTQLALELCEHLPCEIVSVDSALIYRQMDIGTAKPSATELAQVRHHLIDIIDPAQSYSVANFRHDALQVMADITARDKIPLLVGGTMMYFKSLVDGLSSLPAADEKVRESLAEQADAQGWDKMHQWLKEVDPISAQRIHPNDPQRLMRALEVFLISGKSMTELTEQTSAPIPYQVRQFALLPSDRKILHQRIEQRFHLMLEMGFEQEVQKLRQCGDLNEDMPSIRCVGYRQMWQYLDGQYGRDEMVFKGIAATRQLAKRQYTWLRSWKNLTVLDGSVKQSLTSMMKLSNTD